MSSISTRNNAIAERLRELRRESGKNQADFAAIAGASRNSQVNYETGKSSPDAAYLAALQAAGFDVQYVLTGFRIGEVPGAREFMGRMEEAAGKMRALWRAYGLPEDESLFAAMQGVRAVPGVSDGHTASLAQAFATLLKEAEDQTPNNAAPITAAASAVARSVQVDGRLLKDCIAGVEEFLHKERGRMPLDKKAALIVEVYGHFLDEQQRESKRASRTNVVEFIRRRVA